MSKRVANSKATTKSRRFKTRRRQIEKARARKEGTAPPRTSSAPRPTSQPWHKKAMNFVNRMFRRKTG